MYTYHTSSHKINFGNQVGPLKAAIFVRYTRHVYKKRYLAMSVSAYIQTTLALLSPTHPARFPFVCQINLSLGANLPKACSVPTLRTFRPLSHHMSRLQGRYNTCYSSSSLHVWRSSYTQRNHSATRPRASAATPDPLLFHRRIDAVYFMRVSLFVPAEWYDVVHQFESSSREIDAAHVCCCC